MEELVCACRQPAGRRASASVAVAIRTIRYRRSSAPPVGPVHRCRLKSSAVHINVNGEAIVADANAQPALRLPVQQRAIVLYVAVVVAVASVKY